MTARSQAVLVAVTIAQCNAVCVPPATQTEQAGWREFAPAGCEGSDIAATTGSAAPDDGLCNSHSQEGTIAICWDQQNYTNSAMSGPWCTYKQGVQPLACQGGPNPGKFYVCYYP